MEEITDKKNLKKWFPYPIAILVFIIIVFAYVSPVLEGKQLLMPDIVNFEGMAKEIRDFRAETGEEALWTNSMFGGMPAFQISMNFTSNVSRYLHDIMTLSLPRPADFIFLYLAGFFILLILMRVNPWIALTGAIAFAFASYNFIIIEAGHTSKANAIGYMAPVLASIIYTFRKNYLAGGILFAIFMSLQLYANHYQITYYLLIIVIIYGLFKLYEAIRQKQVKDFIKPVGVLMLGVIIAIGVNIGTFWSTYSYTPHTMRGGTELTIGEREVSEGLSKDYITSWSYGIGETFSLMIPNVKGGASKAIGNNPRALNEVDPRFRDAIAQQNQYWGNQPFTSGPVYMGAVVIVFFALGLYLFKGSLKWALLVATVLSLFLSWGKNFMPLTEFFIDYVPFYDKFRAVSMSLVIAGLCIPFIAIKGVQKIYEKPGLVNFKDRWFLLSVGFTVVLTLLFYLMPRMFFSFISENEIQMIAAQSKEGPQIAAQMNQFVNNLENARVAIFKADTIRSFIFMALAFITIIAFSKNKISKPLFLVIITLLILVDMWGVNKRYLNNDDFKPARIVENPIQPTQANIQIMEDPDTNFRVYNTAVNTFNESTTSYFHFSIGGYHGAKLQRYQEMIDFHLIEMNMDVINMLNTRYFIVQGENRNQRAQYNSGALGNAWFVQEYEIVKNADEEILALNDFDPAGKAIIDKRYAEFVEGKSFEADPKASIEHTQYQPNKLKYEYYADSEQLAVFSEIFYEDGWKTFVNGEPVPHFRVNYVLRAMVLPPGENEIEFRFEPSSYYQGERIAFAFSVTMVLLIFTYIGKQIYRYRRNIQ